MAEQVWVADITYIETVQTIGYLSLITDAYSRRIMGHHLHPSLHTDGVLKTELLTAKPLDLSQAATMNDQAVEIYNFNGHVRPWHTKRPMRCIGRL